MVENHIKGISVFFFIIKQECSGLISIMYPDEIFVLISYMIQY